MESYFEAEYKQKAVPLNIKAKSTDKVVFKNLPSRNISSLKEYLSIEPLGSIDGFDIIDYWVNSKDCPLKQFALDTVTIPGSNATVERLFSVSALVEDKKRLKLGSELKKEVVCLHSWLNNVFLEKF